MLRLSIRIAVAAGLTAFTAFVLPANLRAQGDVAKSFKTNCALCHAPDGSGSSPTGKALKAKDLRSPEVQQQSDADLTLVISKGKGKMPAFGAKLKPGEIKGMVAYVRELAKTK
jgi:cytochrome c6